MAKTRMLKHGLRTSEKVASWPVELRYFWVLLWGYVDDHGKGRDNPLLVKADCFPLDEKITRTTVDKWLWDLVAADVVVRYTVDDVDYVAVRNWGEHQKPPHPTEDVLPSFEVPGATIRAVHAKRMKDAGSSHAELSTGLGWVESGFGSGVGLDAHLTASVSFDDFWEAYPKKNNRADAERAWAKAIKLAAPAQIVRAARTLAESPYRPAKQFIPYGATWLNRQQWNDPAPEPPEEERGKPTPEQRLRQTVQLGTDLDLRELES